MVPTKGMAVVQLFMVEKTRKIPFLLNKVIWVASVQLILLQFFSNNPPVAQQKGKERYKSEVGTSYFGAKNDLFKPNSKASISVTQVGNEWLYRSVIEIAPISFSGVCARSSHIFGLLPH